MSKTDECWVSLAEAARGLGTTPLNLLMRVKRGSLKGKEVDGAWFIEGTSLEVFGALEERPEAVCQGGCAQSRSCAGCG